MGATCTSIFHIKEACHHFLVLKVPMKKATTLQRRSCPEPPAYAATIRGQPQR